MKVVLVASSHSGNALGRVHSNWLAARAAGLEARTLTDGVGPVWRPVRDDAEFLATLTTDEDEAARWADVAIAHKPRPESYGRALRMRRRTGVPIVLDVDDPDYEARYGESRRQRAAILLGLARDRQAGPLVRFPGLARHRWRGAREEHVTVSNPGVSAWYGDGVVLPHARVVPPHRPPAPAADGPLRVGFVGTVRAHKGVADLRDAVAATPGTELTLTADPPADARPRERWVGETSLEEGRRIVASSDVIPVVSNDTVYGRGQLPAKLVDAMLAGCAVIGSDLPPIRWALGSAGIVLPPDHPDALTEALVRLRDDPGLRADLGEAARERARSLFSEDAVGETLRRVCQAAARR